MKLIKRIYNYLFPQKDLIHYALKVVKDTPPEKWTLNRVMDYNGNMCFLGHLGHSFGLPVTPTTDTSDLLLHAQINKINEAVKEFCEVEHEEYIGGSYTINDHIIVNGYTESHPKERMEHVLTDMINKGYK